MTLLESFTRTKGGFSRVVILDVRNNSLNLIRLFLAFLVLVAHSYPLAGVGDGNVYRGGSVGEWAVFGFFAISGYLITASRLANSFGRYLLLRFARIYPAFIVCLVVTALVFAPLAYWIQRGTLAGFFTTPPSPVSYIVRNLPLHMSLYGVAGTPDGVPYPGVWDGSLWSLFFEFCCYLLVGLLLCLALVRHHRWLIAVAYVVSVVGWANADWFHIHTATLIEFVHLLPIFLGGATVQVFVAKSHLRHWIGIISLAATVALVALFPAWGWQAAGPFIAYGLLWISTVMPSPNIIKRHDISYGVYIYAFPVQQILVYTGLQKAGILAYIVGATAGTTVLALVSWRLVERPMLRFARSRGKDKASARPVSTISPTVAIETSSQHMRPHASGVSDARSDAVQAVPATAPPCARPCGPIGQSP